MTTVNRTNAYNKRIRFSEKMIQDCLRIIEFGETDELFEIIPNIGVLRDPQFREPLLYLLEHGDLRRREFAACAMGAMVDTYFLEPLKQAFIKNQNFSNFGGRPLQIAIIEAIGAIGDDRAVDFFITELRKCCETDEFGCNTEKNGDELRRWIVEAIAALAQQECPRALATLEKLIGHEDPEIQTRALSGLAVAYWHRPNEITVNTLQKICDLIDSETPAVAETALATLQNLADVGCQDAEELFR